MQYYVVTFTHTRIFGWLVYLYAHIRYLKKLIKQGKLQISGPGVGTPVRSAQLVFNVTDREELDRLVAADPYSVHDLVASSTVNLWNVEYGSMLKPATPDKKGTKYFRATFELKAQYLKASPSPSKGGDDQIHEAAETGNQTPPPSEGLGVACSLILRNIPSTTSWHRPQ